MIYRLGAAVVGFIAALFAVLIVLWIYESAHGALMFGVAVVAAIAGYRATTAGLKAIPDRSFLKDRVGRSYDSYSTSNTSQPRASRSAIPVSEKDGESRLLTSCKACGKEVSQKAEACPHCGEPVPETQQVSTLKAILILAGAAAFLWYLYGPGIGSYELKSGHVACATKDEVVRYRGASWIGGAAGQARVLASSDCVVGPKPVTVTRLARGTRLIHNVRVDGRKLYADHDAIVKK